jgi:hypothetical protein
VGFNGGVDWITLTVRLSGSAGSVKVCLSNDRVSCAGRRWSKTSGECDESHLSIDEAAPRSPARRAAASCQYQTLRTLVGTINKSGATVTWASGDYFPATRWRGGSVIKLGATDCPILSMSRIGTDSRTRAGRDGSGIAYTAVNFGFLIQPNTASSASVAVSSPQWTVERRRHVHVERRVFRSVQSGDGERPDRPGEFVQFRIRLRPA